MIRFILRSKDYLKSHIMSGQDYLLDKGYHTTYIDKFSIKESGNTSAEHMFVNRRYYRYEGIHMLDTGDEPIYYFEEQ